MCALYIAVGLVACNVDNNAKTDVPNSICSFRSLFFPAKSACPYFDQGRKFLVLILTELVVQVGVVGALSDILTRARSSCVQNLIELLVPQFKLRVLPLLAVRFRGQGSDEDLKPGSASDFLVFVFAHDETTEFDVAEEYLELLYRQFIVYIGFVIVFLRLFSSSSLMCYRLA